MTRILAGLCATLVLAAPCFAAPANETKADDAKALIDIENKLSDAYKNGDVEYIKKIVDETYTLTNSHAKVSVRADDIEEVTKGDPHYDVFSTHDMKPRVYGDAAVVLGIVSLKGTAGGQPFDADMRFTDTFVRRDGQWRMVAAQVTRMEK